jgi:large subunit ribosomal protein L10
MAEKAKKPHVSGYKKKIVDDFVKLIKEYPIIGALNMENLPAPQLQVMRGQLRNKVVMRMTKRRLIKIAIEQAKADKKGIEKLEQYLKGMPALLFSKENPFKLYKILKKSKSSAPAKAGQTAPKDIFVQAGPTPFAPGPVIGELGALGVKTAVEGGKVTIQKDTVVVREGEVIKANAAGMLTRLGIEPMEIGLDLVAVYEDGTIYSKNILDIDEKQVLANLQNAHRWSLNLAVESGYFTKDTINMLVPKAFNEAKALALEANIMADAVAEELIAKAEAQAKGLKEEIKYEGKAGKIEEKPKEEAKEEPKAEEKKEEIKPEPGKKEEVKPEKTEAPKPQPERKAEPKVEEKKPEPGKEEKETAKLEVPKEEKKEEPIKETKKEPKTEEKKYEAKEDVKTRTQELKEKLEKAREIVKTKPEIKQEPKVKREPGKSGIIRDIPKKRSEVLERKKQEIQSAEDLFRQLQKKGTLRGIQRTEIRQKTTSEPLSPQQIIERGVEKMRQKQEKDVPSAYELMQKKLKERK